MTVQIELRATAPPDAVLAAIREHASYWQESQVPPELRALGSYGVEVRLDGPRFRLALDSHRDPPPSEFVLRGEVTERPDGGSSIRASAVSLERDWLGVVLIGGLTLVLALGAHWWAATLLAAGGGGWAWLSRRRMALLTQESDAGLRHLVARLEAAVSLADRQASRPAR